MNASRLAPVAAFVLTVGIFAAAVARNPRETASSCAPVLESEVCTWVVTEGPAPVEFGATIPLSLIEGVPADVEMVWPPQELASIPMPSVARSALGIDHLGINWEANGHPPTTFLTQHFDFHFYTISENDVRVIDCANEAKPAGLPATYALPDIDVPGLGTLVGLCVPSMGMHAMQGHDVHATDPFKASMILGYYGGRPIFIEPMISRAQLLQRADFTMDMPEAPGSAEGALYPTEFRAEYVADSDAYRLVFSGLGRGGAASGS